MWDLLIQLLDGRGQPLQGHGVRVSFRIRLGDAGPDEGMPAEVRAQTDASGAATLRLPPAGGLAETLRIAVTGPADEPLYDASHRRDALVATSPLVLTLGEVAPTHLKVQLRVEGSGAPLGDVDLVLLARPVGAETATIALMGRTNAEGALEGPYPAGPFAEVNALLRLNPDRIVPVALRDGALPGTVALTAPARPAPATAPATAPVLAEAAAPAAPRPLDGVDTLPPADGDGEAPPEEEEAGDAEAPDLESPPAEGRRRRRSRVNSRAMPDQLTLVLLGVVIFVGVILRFYSLGGPSLWNDELSSWRRTDYSSLAKVLEKGVIPDVHPPGYYLMLYGFQKFGDSEWMLRAPSAIAGVATLVFVFLMGRRLWSDREGLLAAGLMAVVWAPIRYSQEVRAYSFVMLFSTISMWLWIDLLRQVDRRGTLDPGRATAYILSAAGLAYLHYFGLLLVLLQGAGAIGYSLWRGHRRPAAPTMVAIYAAVGALYLPWARYLWQDLTEGSSWIEEPDDPSQVVFFGYLEFLFNHSVVLTALLALLVGAAAFSGALTGLKDKKLTFSARAGWGVVALWLVVPFAVAWTKSVIGTPVLSNRNLLISAPAAYLLVARAVTALPVPSTVRNVLGVSLIGLSFLNFASTGYYSKPNRQQFREAVAYVVDHSDDTKNSAIVVTGNPGHFNYYFDRLGAEHNADLSASNEGDIPKLQNYIQENKPRFVWRLRTGNRDAGPVEDWLKDGFAEVETESFYGMSVSLYKRGGGGGDDGAEDPDAEAGAPDAGSTDGTESASEGEGGSDTDAPVKKKNKKKNKKSGEDGAADDEAQDGTSRPPLDDAEIQARKKEKKAAKAAKKAAEAAKAAAADTDS